MTTAPPDTRPSVRDSPLRDPAVWLRVALAVVGLGLVGVVLALGSRQSSYADLEQAIARGNVHAVSVTDGLRAGEKGAAPQELRWRDGLIGRRTEVVQIAPGESQRSDPEATATFHQDVAAHLRAEHPDLRIVRVEARNAFAEIAGFDTPAWTAYATWLFAALALGALIARPHPWRATRWAWFWLFWTPVGIPAFVLFSGPFPLLPKPRPGRRRLTGGWAFLILVVWNAVS